MKEQVKRGLCAASIAVLSAGLAGCFSSAPKTHTMHASSRIAGEGFVKATTTDDGNTALTVQVKHLAPPAKIAADATTYVVWIQPSDASVQSVGALALNDNWEGSLDSVTPHSRFKVFLTAEPSARVSQPSHEPVLSAQIEQAD